MQMREGNLWKNILLYSIPLMFTNLLQVFFNLADIAVVGKFAGSIALGAVGSTTILITLTTGWLIGMSNGVNSLTARFIGAEEEDSLRKCIHTGFVLCLGTGILVTVLGICLSAPVLALMKTKDELISEALIYFRIYMLGSPALGIYNYGNAVLSAAGDTKKPLRFLAIAGGINIVLNLIFVIVFKMSSAGVALASIISQYISAVLVLRELLKTQEAYRLRILRTPAASGRRYPDASGMYTSADSGSTCTASGLRAGFSLPMLGRLLSISVPAAIQYSLFAVANLFVQSAVNSFDHVTVEGNSAAANADSIIYEMMAAFYVGSTSFIGQNLGARKYDRILKTYLITTVYSFGIGLVLGLALYAFREPFLYLFTNDADVVARGLERVGIMAFSYCISAFMDNATAAARGLGKTAVPTAFVILGTVVFRIIWIYTIFAKYHTLTALYLLYACAWVFTAIMGNIYFFREYGKLKSS